MYGRSLMHFDRLTLILACLERLTVRVKLGLYSTLE